MADDSGGKTANQNAQRRPSERAEGPNSGVYESEAAVAKYREQIPRELFDAEEYIIDTYFEGEGAAVLDIGCGTGRTTKPLADRGFDVVGIDQSEQMVEAARDLYPDIEFRVDDATNLSDPAETYEYVFFSYNGIDCIYPKSQRLRALREAHRVLRPGGVFAFSSHNWLYSIPALVDDFTHIEKYYLRSGNPKRLGSPYKKDGDEFDLFMHWGSPWKIKANLDDCGFDRLEWVTKRDNPLRYFENNHHYVVQKPSA